MSNISKSDTRAIVDFYGADYAGDIMAELQAADSFDQIEEGILTITAGCSNFLTIFCCY